ncbi:MAG TPA: MnhB domain-containing protein, partial [Candidatus Thermoplasmatota archaeon]|nr:MnhB domain-containing protein [Candidatus Thermoplasmatota archaeon]
MTTVIARTATSFLFSLLVLFALLLLLRGHHEPGGGFVGGLVAGGAIALYAFTHSIEDARRLFAADPRHV